jgi:hypothetical protein
MGEQERERRMEREREWEGKRAETHLPVGVGEAVTKIGGGKKEKKG